MRSVHTGVHVSCLGALQLRSQPAASGAVEALSERFVRALFSARAREARECCAGECTVFGVSMQDGVWAGSQEALSGLGPVEVLGSFAARGDLLPASPDPSLPSWDGRDDHVVVVNEEGKVLSATLVKSVHERYDEPLLEAAKSWTFKPALRSGVPVRYRHVMPVRVLR